MSAPTRRPEQPDECAATPRRAAAFLAGSLAADELRALRAHRGRCCACDETWRRSITTVSHMGARARREREELAAEERDDRRRRTASRPRSSAATGAVAPICGCCCSPRWPCSWRP